MPIGAKGYIGIKKEVTWGTKVILPTIDNDCFLPFISETLTPNIEEVLSAAQRAIADEPVSYQGERSFVGDIVLEVHPASIGHILRSVINVPESGVPGTAEEVLDDCEKVWDELVDPGVFSGLDTIDKKKGNSSVKIQVTTGVEAGDILATKDVSVEEVGIDMTGDTHIKFKIKSDVACDAGVLILMISEVAECDGVEHTTMKSMDIPALEAGVWKECTIALGKIIREDIAFVEGEVEADDTITTVAGDFLAAGFVEGNIITVSGSTANSGPHTIISVVEKTINIANGTLTGEAAGPSITITSMDDFEEIISMGIKMAVNKDRFTINIDDIRRISTFVATDANQHVFIPRQADDFNDDCPLNPYTLEVYRDQGKAFQFLGAVVNTLALSFGTTEKILKATCGIIAKNLGSVDKATVGLEPPDPFTWNQATIKIGNVGEEGTIDNDIESFGINIDNACRGHYTCNRTVIPRKIIRDGYRTIPINFVTEFTDQTEFDLFILGTERAFQVIFEGEVLDAPIKYTLQIDMPKVKYTAYPINIGGPGRLTCAVTGKAKYDATAGVLYPIKFTLINKETGYN